VYKRIVTGALLLITLSVAGCGGTGNPVRATWLNPRVTDNTVTIPASQVRNAKITHFNLALPKGEIAFMAYEVDRKLQVRADICPPCRSESYSLAKDKLICDTCATVFDARTGAGVQGACVAFPKAAVNYQITDGAVVMKVDDLMTAYLNTLKPGWP